VGIATSQKSFLKIKVIILLVSLLLTGIIMRSLSPPHKLDTRAYYSYEEGKAYLEALTEIQKQKYLLGELFDFWFMINYTWLLLLAFKKYLPRKLLWMAFVPGILDLGETGLITFYLHFREITSVHQLLPFFSSLKWFLGFSILLYLGKMAFWRRANC
jgi:hypothetical protein